MLSFVRRLVSFLAVIAAFGLLTRPAQAEITWSPQTGWVAQGGLSGLVGKDGKTALSYMNRARTAEENHSYFSALRNYKRVTKKYPSSIYAPEAFFHTGEIRLRRRQYFKSFDAYQEVVTRYPNFDRFDYVIKQQYEIADKLLAGARNRIFGVIPSFVNREKAVEYFERVLLTAPYSEFAPLALMKIAQGHQRLGNTEEGIDALDRLINTYPQSVLAPDAYLRRAQTHASLVDGAFYDQASTREAITYYQDFTILYPGDKGVGEAEKGLGQMKTVLAQSKIKMGDFYFYKRHTYVAARVFYNEAITAYPDSEVASLARKRLANVESKAEYAAAHPK